VIRPGATLLVFSCLWTGCAGYQAIPQPPASREHAQIRELEADMQAAEQELGQLQTREEPDCSRICQLRNNICELASRICLIAEQHPDQSDLQESCQDGIKRCERARARVAGTCQCPGPP